MFALSMTLYPLRQTSGSPTSANNKQQTSKDRKGVMVTITTGGTDLHITERAHGGWTIRQGRSHLLLTSPEAGALANALSDLLTQASRPGQARMLRYRMTRQNRY